MKYSFTQKYNYFVLFWFTLTGMFNGIFLVFVGSAQKFLMDFVFSTGLFFLNRKARKFSDRELLFISFYFSLTLLSLLFYFDNNHYGFQKLLNNVILTLVSFYNFYLVYKVFKDECFSPKISFLFKFQIFIEFCLYIFFVLYNKKNGILGITPIQLFVLQDWSGRFQGSFSEPSSLGLWFGISIFIIFILYRNFLGYVIGGVFLFALYNACKAKFALIAFPLVLIFAFVLRKISLSDLKNNYSIFLVFFFICAISLFWKPFTSFFFSIIAKLFDKTGSATYVTRFGFMLSSLKDICLYPLGHGVGMNYEVFQNIFSDIVPIAKKVNLEVWELEGYKLNPNNMGSKDTFSLFATTCGFVGIYFYFSFFNNLLKKKYLHKFFSISLISFCFIESLVTGNVISDSAFFILLFAKMALNTDQEKNE